MQQFYHHPGAVPSPTTLIDQFGRKVDYIRLSITDRCDFRCTYCMSEDMEFLPRDEILSLEECERLVRTFVGLGVRKVRITGGEPLVRKDAISLFERIGRLEGLHELVLTTNGSQLEQYATPLFSAGVKRINISLDSLDQETFRKITRVGDLRKVLNGIEAARKTGFESIKLNTVIQRGINDHEIEDIVHFARAKMLDIAFIEEMPLGAVNHERSQTWFSNDDILKRLQKTFSLSPSRESTGGPARYWRMADSQIKIGFISPHSHNFCESCNRVRITCKGELYLCLGQDDKVDLKAPLRDHPEDDNPLKQAILEAMRIKPQGHDFDIHRAEPSVVRFMSLTGG